MRGQADPWGMTVLLESLKTHWVVSCNGGSRDEKGGMSRNKYDVPPIPIGKVNHQMSAGTTFTFTQASRPADTVST